MFYIIGPRPKTNVRSSTRHSGRSLTVRKSGSLSSAWPLRKTWPACGWTRGWSARVQTITRHASKTKRRPVLAFRSDGRPRVTPNTRGWSRHRGPRRTQIAFTLTSWPMSCFGWHTRAWETACFGGCVLSETVSRNRRTLLVFNSPYLLCPIYVSWAKEHSP